MRYGGNVNNVSNKPANSTSNFGVGNKMKPGLVDVQQPGASRNSSLANSVKNSALPLAPKYNLGNNSNFKQSITSYGTSTNINSLGRSLNSGTASKFSSTTPSKNVNTGGFKDFETFNSSMKSNINSNYKSSGFRGNNLMQVATSAGGTGRVTATSTATKQNKLNGDKNVNQQNICMGMKKVSNVSRGWDSSAFSERSISKQEETTSDSVKTLKKAGKKDDRDSSMRIFTCSISSMKSWPACNKTDILVMFEIYGVVDSATLKDPTGTGKEFILRDDTSSIKCVFYEIDRELPRLIRGQVHRVIGLMKKDKLQVVSVRIADKEERQVCILASEVSQREMEELMGDAQGLLRLASAARRGSDPLTGYVHLQDCAAG
ncbi:hypothetical protein Btru_001469 [Bulinus truncatus]|nr:hypothetical protein Btru_001469 [Bulinus truncatus]